ncbi:tRNA (adenosine(37)-N6)-dimethylallyltransferase MiaA [Candidatus Dependentiae bacterium]
MGKKLKQKFIILVYGPTGVGKSGFSEKLATSLQAKKLPAQLVNCDIGQFYTKFGIGTAKPDWQSGAIKQHLFDIINEPKSFNVSEYRNLLFETIEKIWEQNNIPILVGGSGFYLKSLFFPPIDDEVIASKQEIYQKIGGQNNPSSIDLWEKLHEIDPQRAAKIDKNDTYRVKRALEIWEKTGLKPSEFVPMFDFPSNFLFVFLNRERRELYERIDKRTYQMVHEGWIQEVEELMGTKWEHFFKEKKLIGYDVIVDYLKGDKDKKSLEKTVKIIQKKTRNYAKRQVTFWRSFCEQLEKESAKSKEEKVETKIETVNLTFLDLDLYIKQLVAYLEKLFD